VAPISERCMKAPAFGCEVQDYLSKTDASAILPAVVASSGNEQRSRRQGHPHQRRPRRASARRRRWTWRSVARLSRIVGRNKEKSERVLSDLKTQSGNPHIELILGDLSKLADVRAVAAAFKASTSGSTCWRTTPALCFRPARSRRRVRDDVRPEPPRLLPADRKSCSVVEGDAGSRIVSTSSGAHRGGRIDFDTIAKLPNWRWASASTATRSSPTSSSRASSRGGLRNGSHGQLLPSGIRAHAASR